MLSGMLHERRLHVLGLNACRLLLAVAAGFALSGCMTGTAARDAETADRKAEKIRQAPAEIMKAGDEAARAGQLDRAASLYTQAVELKPSADLWYRLGYIYSRLDKKPLAMHAYTNGLRLDDHHAAIHEELGMLLLDARRREAAKQHLVRAVEIDDRRWRSHNALGVLADADRDYAGAIDHYEAALAIQPDSPMLLNNVGYSHYLDGRLEQAREYYDRALAIDADYRPAVFNVALLHARRREYDKALDLMQKLVEKTRACNDIGYVALQNGDLDQAEDLLREAIRLSPSHYRVAHENLARVQEARQP